MFEAYISLILFSLLLLGTPGPAPLAIAATGAVFGINKGFKFLFGLVVGFAGVVLIQGFAMLMLVKQNHSIILGLQLFGFLYILYIAYKIAFVPVASDQPSGSSPPSCLDGLLLNLTNPKAYAAMTVIYSQFLLPHNQPKWAYFFTGLVCLVMVFLIDLIWLFMGQLLRPLMQNPKTNQSIRLVFAVLMVGAVIWMIVQSLTN